MFPSVSGLSQKNDSILALISKTARFTKQRPICHLPRYWYIFTTWRFYGDIIDAFPQISLDWIDKFDLVCFSCTRIYTLNKYLISLYNDLIIELFFWIIFSVNFSFAFRFYIWFHCSINIIVFARVFIIE